MKVVILAGGFGTRLSEETDLRPKPMLEIGGKPILWHIMKIYSYYGCNDFIVCLGYKGYMIKEYFHHYHLHHSDTVIDLRKNSVEYYNIKAEPWRVTLVDTGLTTMTGGRIKRIKHYIKDETFMLTYGDGVGNIDITRLLEFHAKNGKPATLTVAQPSGGRFGIVDIDNNDNVISFKEKPQSDNTWINAGFFVLSRLVFNYINDDGTIWEREPLENLSRDGMLNAYKHEGFWKPMDTLRDKRELEKYWKSGNAEWKLWTD
jgi:glucose-1-phosphate cytidylyltransferase